MSDEAGAWGDPDWRQRQKNLDKNQKGNKMAKVSANSNVALAVAAGAAAVVAGRFAWKKLKGSKVEVKS